MFTCPRCGDPECGDCRPVPQRPAALHLAVWGAGVACGAEPRVGGWTILSTHRRNDVTCQECHLADRGRTIVVGGRMQGKTNAIRAIAKAARDAGIDVTWTGDQP